MFAFNFNILLIFITINLIKLINCELKMTVVHTNDMHSRFLETSRTTGTCKPGESCYGGFARVAHEVKRIKSEIPNTLFLNAGDSYQGTALYSLFKYRVVLEFLDKLNIDTMSLGNHEFDDGVKGLTPFLQQVRIPVVTCNLDTTNEPSLIDHTALKPWHMLEVNKVKIGIVGYLTPETKFLSSPGKVKFLDEITMIQKYIPELKEAGAKLIFGLGHSGFIKDQEIAKKIPELDLVIGGHTDTFLYTGTPPDIEKPAGVYPLMIEQPSGKKVPVVQAYGYTKYLGKLDLVWDDNFNLVSATGNPILLNSTVPKDKEVEAKIQEWSSRLSETLQVKKGETKVLLDGKCRLNECNLGNFITDSFASYVMKQDKNNSGWSDSPIILLASGAIRTSIEPTDNITTGDLLTVMPFGNKLVRLGLKGSTLLKALHRSVERYDISRNVGYGEFLQISGLKVEYIQGEGGKLTLKSAQAKCGHTSASGYKEIDPYKRYVIVTTQFVADGGDGYSMLKNEATLENIYEGTDIDIIADYLEEKSPIEPTVEGRINIPLKLQVASSSDLLHYNLYFVIINLLSAYVYY